MTRRHWSPEPEMHNTPAKLYRNDPYAIRGPGRVFYYEEDLDTRAATPTGPPAGTLHGHLWGRVTFVEYPAEEFHAPAPAEDEEMVRVFIGQLPYFVTDMQLRWLCYHFGGFNTVHFPERIMKRQPNGERLPTGCIHAYAPAHAVAEMASGMHKRMLVDDTGVWHAQTQEEFAVLTEYIAAMKADKSLRAPNRPYDSVVVQVATSTFVPVCPMPLTEFPNERRVKVPQRQSPPPPAYDAIPPPPPYASA